MSLKSLINGHFSEQPINNKYPSTDIDNIVKENIVCDEQDICCDSIKTDVINEIPIQQTVKNCSVAELLKIKLLIPYSEYNMGGFYYVMNYNDVKEISMNKAKRLIEQGFAIEV